MKKSTQVGPFLIRSCATPSRHREKAARSPNQRPGIWDAIGDIPLAKLDEHPYRVITVADFDEKSAFRWAKAGQIECQEDTKNVVIYVAK